MMKIRRKLKPGQPGTKRLMDIYGHDLVCVRYRYDEETLRRIKTVELIVKDTFWQPDPLRIPGNKIINVRIAFEEKDLRNTVKEAGGIWNPSKKLWELGYKKAIDLGLEKRIV